MKQHTFFSVDVETSSTSPWTGHLLSVGVVALTETEGDLVKAGEFYVRVQAGRPGTDGIPNKGVFDPDSYEWWQSQKEESPRAFDEVFNAGRVRHEESTAARMLAEFVVEHQADRSLAIFAANPVSFDWPWVDLLLRRGEVENPFSHRTLCLRSAGWAQRPSMGAGDRIREHASEVPHHALFDAKAQALDLIDIWQARREGVVG